MKEIITQWQLATVIFNFLLGTSVVFNLEIIYGHRDTWIAEVLGIFFGLTIFFMIYLLVNKYPNQEVGQIFEQLFGRIGAIFVMLIFSGFAFYLGALVLNNIQGIMNTMVMQETPPWIFILSMSLTTAIVIRYGVEVFARCSEVITPLIITLMLLLYFLAFREIDFSNFKPMFIESIRDIVKATIVTCSFPYADGILLFFLTVLVKKSKEALWGNMVGILISAPLLFLRPIYIIGAFGTEEATDLVYPFYILARFITIGDFFERIELIYLVVWFFTTFIKLGVCFYVVAKGIQYLFKLDDYKKLMLPLSILAFPFALIAYSNYQETFLLITSGSPIIGLGMFGFLSLIVLRALSKQSSQSSTPS